MQGIDNVGRFSRFPSSPSASERWRFASMTSDARSPFSARRWASRSFGCSANPIAFIRVADGVEGHTQVIGLFAKDRQASGDGQTWDGWNPGLSTLHHFAIEISLSEYENDLQ